MESKEKNQRLEEQVAALSQENERCLQELDKCQQAMLAQRGTPMYAIKEYLLSRRSRIKFDIPASIQRAVRVIDESDAFEAEREEVYRRAYEAGTSDGLDGLMPSRIYEPGIDNAQLETDLISRHLRGAGEKPKYDFPFSGTKKALFPTKHSLSPGVEKDLNDLNGLLQQLERASKVENVDTGFEYRPSTRTVIRSAAFDMLE